MKREAGRLIAAVLKFIAAVTLFFIEERRLIIMRLKFAKLVWGTFLLLAAAFVLFVNQSGGFANIGVGSIVVAVLALAFIVLCVTRLYFAPLPIPFAALYVIFQKPLSLPVIQIWALVIAALLASIGLAIMLPPKR